MHAEAPQVIHGTVEVDRPVEVKASGSKSAEALVDLANEIWQEVRDSGVSVDDHPGGRGSSAAQSPGSINDRGNATAG